MKSHQDPKKISPKSKKSPQDPKKISPNAKKARAEPKGKRTRHGDEDKSFARRAKPTTDKAQDQWRAIRDVFNEKIHPKLDCPSSHQETCMHGTSWLETCMPVDCTEAHA